MEFASKVVKIDSKIIYKSVKPPTHFNLISLMLFAEGQSKLNVPMVVIF